MIVLILIHFNNYLVVFIIHLIFGMRFCCLGDECFRIVLEGVDQFGMRMGWGCEMGGDALTGMLCGLIALMKGLILFRSFIPNFGLLLIILSVFILMA